MKYKVKSKGLRISVEAYLTNNVLIFYVIHINYTSVI